MALEIGKYEAEIRANTVQTFGDKEAVKLYCDVAGEQADVMIWISDKSYGIARRSLSLCGFDIDKDSLGELIRNPKLLAGRKVAVLVEEYNGKTRAGIWLNPEPPAKRIAALDKALRAAKVEADGTRREPKPDTAPAAVASDGPGFPYGDNDGTEEDSIPF